MNNHWQSIIQDAAKETVSDFSEKVSSLIRLTNKEIEAAIPEGVDHSKFAELIQIVNDNAISNEKKADQIRKVEGYAEIAANLLIRLI